ncbi:hypothetical protein J7J62_03915 [bacterium]|nr:hypothetical protein [bacterium]
MKKIATLKIKVNDLVSTNVGVYKLNEDDNGSIFHEYSSCCKERIKYVKVCGNCGKEVTEILKGIKLDDEKLIFFHKEDLEQLKHEGKVINLIKTVKQINPLYFAGELYILEAEKDDKLINLIANYKWLGHMILRGNMINVAVFPFNGQLLMAKIRPIRNIKIEVPKTKVTKKEKELFDKIVEEKNKEEFTFYSKSEFIKQVALDLTNKKKKAKKKKNKRESLINLLEESIKEVKEI